MNSTYYCPCDGPSWSGGSTYPYSSGAGGGQVAPRLVTNQKRQDWLTIKGTIDQVIRELGSEPAYEGAPANATTLTKGLGGDGSVWQSPLAERLALKLQDVVKSLDGNFVSERDWIEHLLVDEPEEVEQDDPRSKDRG